MSHLFFLGRPSLELAQGTSGVALALHKAGGSTPFGVTVHDSSRSIHAFSLPQWRSTKSVSLGRSGHAMPNLRQLLVHVGCLGFTRKKPPIGELAGSDTNHMSSSRWHQWGEGCDIVERWRRGIRFRLAAEQGSLGKVHLSKQRTWNMWYVCVGVCICVCVCICISIYICV